MLFKSPAPEKNKTYWEARFTPSRPVEIRHGEELDFLHPWRWMLKELCEESTYLGYVKLPKEELENKENWLSGYLSWTLIPDGEWTQRSSLGWFAPCFLGDLSLRAWDNTEHEMLKLENPLSRAILYFPGCDDESSYLVFDTPEEARLFWETAIPEDFSMRKNLNWFFVN